MLIGDHAGRVLPVRLGDMGVGSADLDRHIAWDIGVAGLGLNLSRRLDAAFIRQRYSRLVIDCNRDIAAFDSIPEISDGTIIPANIGLGNDERTARIREVFTPYHDRIKAELAARQQRSTPIVLVSLHSFTPVMAGAARPWRFGVLHRNDSDFSRAVLEALRDEWGDEVGDNQPYAMETIDFTVPYHAAAFGLDYLEIEVRQDLIADEAGQAASGAVLAAAFRSALDRAQ